ncbi:MAG: DUF6600 domain-containing protein, partial [Kofleriaceae bacterium]
MPQAYEPEVVAGPPGGGMDPGYGYPDPSAGGYAEVATNTVSPGYPSGYAPGYPSGYPDGYPDGSAPDSVPVGVESSSGAVIGGVDAVGGAPGASIGMYTGAVNDAEIDATLAPHGEWVEDDEYGRVWRPYATVVGVEFTPYESCGTWVYTEYGWTFTCEWDWGWLPFHYGQWAWLDSYWGWIPDYTWSPAWVDWRYGGGYVGWRPSAPRGSRIRDHRHNHGGAVAGGGRIRDHRDRRKQHDSHWRFTAEASFGRSQIRPHLYKNLAEGLRVTSAVVQPAIRGPRSNVSAVMQGRVGVRPGRNLAIGTGVRPQPGQTYQPPRTFQPGQTYQPPRGIQQPRTFQPGQTYQPPRTFQPGQTYQPPRTFQPGLTYQPPRTFQPGQTYQP